MTKINKNKIKALIDATYPRKLSILFLAVLGVAMAGGSTIFDFLRGMVFCWFPLASCVIINVIEDWKLDKIVGKNKFIHDNLTKKELFGFYLFIIVTSFLITIGESWYLRVVIGAEILVGILYSVRGIKFEDRRGLNYITLGIGYGLIPCAIGWFSVTSILFFTDLQMIVLGLAMLFLIIAVQIKDFEDAGVDKKGTTIAHHKHGQKIYVICHALYFLLLLSLILFGVLPNRFVIAFISIPYVVAFSNRFLKASTVNEYTALHHEHHGIMISLMLAFTICFVI